MAPAANCWEFRQCGREPGGAGVAELGVCPAATHAASDGFNVGRNGGRICWAVAGTFCDGIVQGTYAQKRSTCITCEFFTKVMREQGRDFRLLRPDQLDRGFEPPERQ